MAFQNTLPSSESGWKRPRYEERNETHIATVLGGQALFNRLVRRLANEHRHGVEEWVLNVCGKSVRVSTKSRVLGKDTLPLQEKRDRLPRPCVRVAEHARFSGVIFLYRPAWDDDRTRARPISVAFGACWTRRHHLSLSAHCLLTVPSKDSTDEPKLVPYETHPSAGPVRCEADVFRLLGLPYLPPHLRDA